VRNTCVHLWLSISDFDSMTGSASLGQLAVNDLVNE
jgi:hypothetical protein